jgi:hypothetical protein
LDTTTAGKRGQSPRIEYYGGQQDKTGFQNTSSRRGVTSYRNATTSEQLQGKRLRLNARLARKADDWETRNSGWTESTLNAAGMATTGKNFQWQQQSGSHSRR